MNEDASGTLIGEIEEDELPAGSSASGTFQLESGPYVLICNIPGHHQAGMHVGFTVE